MPPANRRFSLQNSRYGTVFCRFIPQWEPVGEYAKPRLPIAAATTMAYIRCGTDSRGLPSAGKTAKGRYFMLEEGRIYLGTSRNPDDIPAFNRKMIEEIAEGKHQKQHA